MTVRKKCAMCNNHYTIKFHTNGIRSNRLTCSYKCSKKLKKLRVSQRYGSMGSFIKVLQLPPLNDNSEKIIPKRY